MDEDEFRKQFMKKSVFRQASSLDLSYVPEKLFCRDEALKTLIFNYRRIMEEKEQPSVNCLILGKGGVGKTCTARYFGKNFRTIAIEKDVKLFLEYFNCINFRSKSKIIRELLAKYQHGSGRGFSDDEALKLILSQLIREKGYMLLIIDEIHLLKPDEVLALLDIAETFGHQNAKLSLLLISRSKDWMTIENERILSRLNEKIRLKPYDFDESKQILKYRSEIALKENVIDEELLIMVSQIVVDHKNMRHGIEILRKSGSYCDKEGLDRIIADIIREASNDVYPTFRNDIVDELKDQELLALYGIVQSLINKDEPFTLVDDAFEDYNVICENYSIEPHVKMSFRKYVRQLTQLKIVTSKTVRIEEATRGRHLEITLLDIPVIKLAELLEDILERKF
ncbi:MAG: AAA family ATPase, partial [Candidatus Lokiarchaeota archaeon]|nr:AAA family ATPase [Candidatus Lokiarchaeota archaeon]MCK4480102.1 AAA family ATPase [Candidatus Lokiarchaeota archaeon]